MKEKIDAAIKIIAKLGSDFNVYDWHKACIQIMDLGLNTIILEQYNKQNPNRSVLEDMGKGNSFVAANFIRNFITFNDDISYIKEWHYLTDNYIKSINMTI